MSTRTPLQQAKSLLACTVSLVESREPWRWIPLVAFTLFMLWAGLDPKGYRFRNEVYWIEGHSGVRFGRFGRVETEPFLTREQAAALNEAGYAIEIALDPTPDPHNAFGVIASFHNGDDDSQVIVGQWRNFLIVMNSDDFSNRRRLPRVTADMAKFAERPLLLTINSTTNGTSLFLNGKAVATNAKWQLKLPGDPNLGRLVLGNTVGASQPWRGVIRSFSLLSRPLTATEIESRWETRGTSSDSTEPAMLIYGFKEASGRTIRSSGTLTVPLTIPHRLNALGPRFLQGSMAATTPDSSLKWDSVVNFIGFMPFGAAIVIVLQSSRRSPCRIVLLAALAGFSLSFAIELTQAWMPTRDSSLRDLLLNTAGAPLGAWFWMMTRERLKRFAEPKPSDAT